MGYFGGDDPAPYITLDGIDYPLVPGSIVEGAPLNPFSPSNSDGNTVAVVSQRHASEVWDDFTGGLGYRDDEPGSHQYAQGTLDTRVPGSTTVPPQQGQAGLGGGSALPYTASHVPVRSFFATDGAGAYCFITYSDRGPTSPGLVRRVVGNAVATVGIPDTEYFRGIAEMTGYLMLLTETAAGAAVLYYSPAATPDLTTFTAALTEAGVQRYGLVQYDQKLISYNGTANTFQQWTGSAWAAYVGGFLQAYGGEKVRQLFVWTDKSGSRDALYCLTNKRILVYDEEGQQWEDLYFFGDLFQGMCSRAEVNRRDSTLMLAVAPSLASTLLGQPTGNILAFTPGTVDNIPINKGNGFQPTLDFGYGGSTLAPKTAYIANLASGIHWLYAFCYAPSPEMGGVFAYNEYGGWTQVVDPALFAGGVMVGGGYGGNLLLTVMANGTYFITIMPDALTDHPQGLYDSQTAGSARTYSLRSGRVYNKQKNIKKLGSHIEVTFKNPLPLGPTAGKGTVYLRWRYFNESGLSAWQSSVLFPVSAQRVSVSLTDGAGSNGVQYYYLEWELNMYMPTTATPPIMESVVLYYTYWQSNRYAYSMNIDLTAETWAEFYPDGTFHGKSREYLQGALLSLLDQTRYHTFTYSQLFFTESLTRCDLSLARRESSDDASGVYGLTVRDLEPDAPTGAFYAV